MGGKRYVQYGCGFCAPAGWRNFDASPTLRFERLPLIGLLYTKNAARFPKNVEYGNIVRGLPMKDQSCEAVYCSHILEHLPLDAFRAALENTYRILRPGGIFRLVVPDLEYCIRQYLTDPSDDAAHSFMKATGLGHEIQPRGVRGFLVSWLGKSQHLWMWDWKAIAFELRRAGFEEVRQARMGDSSPNIFEAVEEPARWENCLGVECRRPR